MSIIKMQTGY
ncbi:UNVERIFIED_CONTAM: hypothetical protein GTU68_000633 [Idotea baltica]|nr:hypothetical protein [Idotea baltica]